MGPARRVWDRPLFSELNSSFRRRQPCIVAHDFGIVWRLELVEAGSRNPNFCAWLKTQELKTQEKTQEI